jgi:hypothetical protein
MEVKNSKTVEGKGLFTTQSYQAGDLVYTLSGKIYDYPMRETIHIGGNKHIYDEYGINHSFTPNIRIDGLNVIALVDINAGDELAFDYNANEVNMASPFYVGDVLVSGKK